MSVREFVTAYGDSAFQRREEVVRCRDCKYARIYHAGKPSMTVEEWYCSWHSNAEGASDIEPDGFCAWGERRADA